MADEPRLRLERVTKTFGSVRALNSVSLELHAGEILALIGENGAGKSTLLRVLSGDHQPDAGQIFCNGQPVRLLTPAHAHRQGVRVIYQEPELVSDLTIADNLYLGSFPRRGGRLINGRRLRTDAQTQLTDSGFAQHLDAGALVTTLSSSERQMVEIVKALVAEASILALDEPTSSLTEDDVDRLSDVLTELRRQGVALIYVSHRIREIMRLADRVAVLRDGQLVATLDAKDTSEQELVSLMVGRQLHSYFAERPSYRPSDPPDGSPPVIDARGLTNSFLKQVDLTVRRGEVVGLAGLIGAGRTELAKSIAGVSPLHSGTIEVDGVRVRMRKPADAIRAGICFAPEDRKAEALFMPRSVKENMSTLVLRRLRTLRVIRQREERHQANALVEQFGIKTPSIEQEVSRLSGGNQQKVVIARQLARKPKLLILDEPTRGIDVGAKAEIYEIIRELTAQGLGVLLISSELPEVIAASDRILVMQNGRVRGELDGRTVTEEEILSLAMEDHLSVKTGTTSGEPAS
jgi:L-arabinose transport system ATP-binding protein